MYSAHGMPGQMQISLKEHNSVLIPPIGCSHDCESMSCRACFLLGKRLTQQLQLRMQTLCPDLALGGTETYPWHKAYFFKRDMSHPHLPFLLP